MIQHNSPQQLANRNTPHSGHPLASYYEVLWQRLQTTCPQRPLTLGVTSCQPHSGVSTVAANLAASAALAVGDKVLLLEATSIRPHLAPLFGVQANPGLAEYFHGAAQLTECLRETGLDRLDVFTAGFDLSSADHTRSSVATLIGSLRNQYGVVVCDLPPAEELSPCLNWAASLDGLVLVVEAGRLQNPTALRAKRRIEQSGGRLLGVVVNKQVDDVPSWMN